MADLWEKLRVAQARATHPPVEEHTAGDDPVPVAESAPPGWSWAAPLVAERRLNFSLDPGFWSAVAGGLRAETWQGMLCFDTETTGLSGGAGTVPFLVGWASLTAPDSTGLPRVEIRQWFLRDLPGEPDLIAALDGVFTQARGLVSFNGASFDLPLLRSRWSLVGRTFPERPHRDDLHPSRRLWKRLLESCSLSRLEEAVLGLRRIDDVPGSLVPALWFDYLRRGAGADFATPLEGVLRHHAQDVYSLLCLDLLLASMRGRPEDSRWEESFGAFPERPHLARLAPAGLLHPDPGRRIPVDFWGLLRLKDEAAAERSLESAWGREPTEAVGLAWADRLKRQGNDRAPRIWGDLWQSRNSYPALEELLKWLEHRERTPRARAEALGLIDQALKAPFLPRVWREALEKRRLRLLRPARPAPT